MAYVRTIAGLMIIIIILKGQFREYVDQTLNILLAIAVLSVVRTVKKGQTSHGTRYVVPIISDMNPTMQIQTSILSPREGVSVK